MSATAGFWCLTCRCHGPIVGDFGFLGAPDIKARTDGRLSSSDAKAVTPTFGYFYDVLAGVGIWRPDLDDFAAWLREHEGHDFALDFNGENADLRALDADPDVRAQTNALWDDLDDRRARGLEDGTLVRGIYTVRCQECGDVVAAQNSDVLRPIRDWQPTPDAVRAFAERWRDAEDMYRVDGALDQYEFLPELIAFFDAHTGHDLRFSVEADVET